MAGQIVPFPVDGNGSFSILLWFQSSVSAGRKYFQYVLFRLLADLDFPDAGAYNTLAGKHRDIISAQSVEKQKSYKTSA